MRLHQIPSVSESGALPEHGRYLVPRLTGTWLLADAERNRVQDAHGRVRDQIGDLLRCQRRATIHGRNEPVAEQEAVADVVRVEGGRHGCSASAMACSAAVIALRSSSN